MRKLNLLLVACALVSVLMMQAQDNPQPLASPMVTLVNGACAACHTLDRVKNKKADAAGWRTTVTRMQGKGAEVTDEQVPLLVDYLVKNAGTLAVAAGGNQKSDPRGCSPLSGTSSRLCGGNNANSDGKNLKVLEGKVLEGANLAATMQSFVRDLGLLEEGTCSFCHVQDRSSDEKMTKVIARNMILMVKDLNAKFPDGKQHVTCFTCHRGSRVPLTAP